MRACVRVCQYVCACARVHVCVWDGGGGGGGRDYMELGIGVR